MFPGFVAEESKSKPDAAGRLEALARAWHTAYRRAELRNAGILAIMAWRSCCWPERHSLVS